MHGQRRTVLGMPAVESVCHSGTPLPPVYHARLRQHVFRAFEAGQRNIRQIGLRIAADEIKNSVSAGIGSGHKRRPGNRSLRRIGRFQAGIAAGGANFCQVGELSAFQHRFHNAGLEPVQSDDNHFFAQEADPESTEFL